MKKLYNVTVEYEMVVLASDEADARDVANSSLSDVFDESYMVRPMMHIPGGWDGGSMPFGDAEDEEREDWTIDQWVEAGAAEEFKKHRDNMRAIAKMRAARKLPASGEKQSQK